MLQETNLLDTSKKIHKCSICETLFNWHELASWYGSYLILDTKPHKINTFCSLECRTKFQPNDNRNRTENRNKTNR